MKTTIGSAAIEISIDGMKSYVYAAIADDISYLTIGDTIEVTGEIWDSNIALWMINNCFDMRITNKLPMNNDIGEPYYDTTIYNFKFCTLTLGATREIEDITAPQVIAVCEKEGVKGKDLVFIDRHEEGIY